MSRRSINGHSRRRSNKRKSGFKQVAPEEAPVMETQGSMLADLLATSSVMFLSKSGLMKKSSPLKKETEVRGRGGFDEAILDSELDATINTVVDQIPIAAQFKQLGQAGTDLIVGDSTGEERETKQKTAALIFAPHKLIAIDTQQKKNERVAAMGDNDGFPPDVGGLDKL